MHPFFDSVTRFSQGARSPFRAVFLYLVLVLSACDSSLNRPDPFEAQEVGVVVNSVELSLTIFPVDDPASAVTVGLGADGSPVGFSFRNGIAAVPMGTFPAVVIVDVAEGIVLRTIGLPEGSGATGSAFLNDSILLVANPDLNTVSPVNVHSGTRGSQISTGAYPTGVVVHGDKAFILNGELGSDWQPARTGTVTVLDASSLELRNTIELSGENPGGAVVVGEALHVLHAGRWGTETGSLSVVDPVAETETDHIAGFGDFPGTLAASPSGLLSLTSWSFGVAIWNPAAGSFVRSPENAVTPGGVPSAAGSGFDSQGRLYVLTPECQGAAAAVRLTATFEEETEVPVGVCPAAIGFMQVEVAVDQG